MTATLSSALPAEFIVVPSPDHPFLLRGPDGLIGGKGNLSAIFTPSASEQRKPDALRARFILSRLALPPHAQAVLVFDRSEGKIAASFERYFDETIAWGEHESIITAVTNGRRRKLPPDIVIQSQRQFGRAMAITSFMQRDSSEIASVSLPTTRGRARKSVDQVNGIDVAFMRWGRFDALNALDLINDRTNRSVELEDGLPVLKTTMPSVAVLERWPFYRHDPNKLLRTAGFAGWAFMTEDQTNQLERVTKYIHRQSLS